MATVALDKSWQNELDTYGSIAIRVVVLKQKTGPEAAPPEAEDLPLPDAEPVEEEAGRNPLSTYLERKKHGKMCVVLLVNGQRHDALDQTFIARSLGFKYLRTRTMIIVDLDGLAPEAIAEIVQGSRQGLYKGKVLDAIKDRIVATLKKDPDLMQLESEAERKISELQAGDEAVRHQLDELIVSHHSGATHAAGGAFERGDRGSPNVLAFGAPVNQPVVIQSSPNVGAAATLPVLDARPPTPALRLRPNVRQCLSVFAVPEAAWQTVENVDVRVEPETPELTVAQHSGLFGIELELQFVEQHGFDRDCYPLEVTLHVHAKFKEHADLRRLERAVRIAPPGPPPPPPTPPVLLATPTFIRVVTRQPVRLVAGGPSAHVRLRWDGLDSLNAGPSPAWQFRATCTTLASFRAISFSKPSGGRFELLLDTPHGILPNQVLDFEVEALGPAGAQLTTTFRGQIAAAEPKPEPRKIGAKAPEATAQRRPPYELKYVKKDQWNEVPCWGESPWTKDDPGCFSEPTETTPLTLMINEDAEELTAFKDGLVAQKTLDETTVKRRVTKYATHIGFHLYQMYLSARAERAKADGADDATARPPADDENREEIRRVARTLLKVMEVSG